MNKSRIDVNITSEIGPLKTVLLHRPGKELERLTIDNMDELLFDDILWLEEAQKQHDAFAKLLAGRGIDVIYLEDCLVDILSDKFLREKILKEVFSLEAMEKDLALPLIDVLCDDAPSKKVAEILIAGITKGEIKSLIGKRHNCLTLMTLSDHDLVMRPLPNLYFQRDPSTFIGQGAILSIMNYRARQKEPLLMSYIFNHHPYFDELDVYYGLDRDHFIPFTLEGGDLLILSPDTIAIGISERTQPGSIQLLGEELARKGKVKKVLAVELPKKRATMHLDTVFTMVDRDAFTIYPGMVDSTSIWSLSYSSDGTLSSIEEYSGLECCLKEALSMDSIKFIETAGGDIVAAAREQWNDGTNTLAIAPGEVVTYRRNEISNKVLRENGIIVHEIDGSELGRGRGGPRCMTMPICRQNL